ncbi:hypothetical protein QJU96_10360 [Pasteurella skyensis]|uniref:Uncharacterized protein n=1 Tax=Phocoenobacter skyensis TaxID=97481 RepID=A0AAJ6P2R0_9PAST|nr:hypothetical protein [Pasteurella skyensis]MDP8171681.1 hypothetical protein [Pasteurella skyensis]MDP8175019.1 hypothetical protein [Pasteurella skyensis]
MMNYQRKYYHSLSASELGYWVCVKIPNIPTGSVNDIWGVGVH